MALQGRRGFRNFGAVAMHVEEEAGATYFIEAGPCPYLDQSGSELAARLRGMEHCEMMGDSRVLLSADSALSKPRCAHFATGFGGGSGGILFFW